MRRNPPINEGRLVADLRKNGQFYIAINLGDIIRRLNNDDKERLEEFAADRLSEFAKELEQFETDELEQSKIDDIRTLGTKLREFVETHKPA